MYRAVELTEGVEVQYLACYVLNWPNGHKPELGFIEASDDLEELGRLAWDAWAALDHDKEENLVGDLAQALEKLGYKARWE